MAGPVLLDTCAAIWLMGGDPLSVPSQTAMRSARTENLGIYLSPFSAWEIGTLVAKGRLHLTLPPEAWFEALLAMPGVRLAALTPKLLISSTSLPGAFLKDPADRIIAATARLYGFRLITRDEKLLDYARQGHILATKC
ncbi:MAG: type II toxin-antitoxin system VapC family toxin [Terracidiphilus sp.]|jgi:PIN domain nuclease of toxin-antitoxin system